MSATDDDFVRDHEGLVRGIARGLAVELGALAFFDDLAAYGMVGLLEARQTYDPDRRVPFAGFAPGRIRGAILDGAQKINGLSAKTRARIKRAQDELIEEQALALDQRGTDPSFDEVAASLNQLFGKLTGTMILDRFAQEQRTPEQRVMSEMDAARLRRAIAGLDDEARKLIQLYYFDEWLVEDAARELGMSRAGFWRAHTEVIAELREALSATPR